MRTLTDYEYPVLAMDAYNRGQDPPTSTGPTISNVGREMNQGDLRLICRGDRCWSFGKTYPQLLYDRAAAARYVNPPRSLLARSGHRRVDRTIERQKTY